MAVRWESGYRFPARFTRSQNSMKIDTEVLH